MRDSGQAFEFAVRDGFIQNQFEQGFADAARWIVDPSGTRSGHRSLPTACLQGNWIAMEMFMGEAIDVADKEGGTDHAKEICC